MPLRSEVDRWNLPALKDWAAAVHTGNEKMLEQIDKARQYFADVGRDWHGAASTAAYDRIGQDHDEARKIYADVDDFLAKFNPAVDNLSSHRDVLRAKVGDAEWAQVTVDDKFACSGPKREDVQSHQDLIDQAYREFVQAEGQLEQLLADRGELVRAAGDLFGSSTEVDEAPTQGGRLGAEDGKRLADAARSRDKNAMDALAGDLPPFYLSPADQQSLADGKQVATIPADVQDYYREFFKASGKDGLLALSDHLAESEKLENAGGSITHPAAMQRDNLANAVMMTSNENVGSTGPDGKFRPGGFTALPDYMQHLVSDRVEVNKPNSAIELRNRFDDQSKFARLLGEASPGFVPGQAMSSQMAATAASMAGYVDGKTPGHEDLINNLKQVGLDTRADDSFFDRDKPKIDDAAKTYLDLATRNHATDVSLLSNPTETVLAKGDYYGDPKTFRNEIFNHDWHDQGKVASQLYSWAGDHAHAQTPDGDLSRKALAALPQVFAPTDHDHPNQLARSGSNTEFQNNADLFKKNPELATGLSKVLAPNLDALAADDQGVTKTWPFPTAGPHMYPTPPTDNVRLGTDDGDRLLFLANQSPDGQHLLETSRALRQAAIYDQAMREGGNNVGEWLTHNEEYSHLQSLNDRMTVQHYNALYYQDNMNAHNTAQHLLDVYESKQKAADVAKMVVDQAIPAKEFTSPLTELLPQKTQDPANTYLNALPDKWMDKAISAWNPAPSPVQIQDPSDGQVSTEIEHETTNNLLDAAHRVGKLPPELVGPDGSPIAMNDDTPDSQRKRAGAFLDQINTLDYVNESKQMGDIAVLSGMAGDQSKLNKFLNGGSEQITAKK